MSVPVTALNISPSRWGALPLLDEANDSFPGLALAYATTSNTDFIGRSALIVMTIGSSATSMIGVKSFTGSYGRLV